MSYDTRIDLRLEVKPVGGRYEAHELIDLWHKVNTNFEYHHDFRVEVFDRSMLEHWMGRGELLEHCKIDGVHADPCIRFQFNVNGRIDAWYDDLYKLACQMSNIGVTVFSRGEDRDDLHSYRFRTAKSKDVSLSTNISIGDMIVEKFYVVWTADQ